MVFACALALLLSLVPMPSRADDGAAQKIDPALVPLMQAHPTALLPVIVEMEHPAATSSGLARANEALDLLRANGSAVGGLAIIDSAAGFADAAGIDALSLVPAVSYIHYDATVRASVAGRAPIAEIPPLPTPSLPPLPTAPPPPPSATATPAATASPSPSPAPTASPAPDPSPTDAPAPSPSENPTPVASESASPSATPVPPSATPAPNESVQPQSTNESSPSPAASYPAVFAAVVNAPAVWAEGATGRNIAVAVLDSGVAHDADLGDRVIASVNFADARTLLDPGGHGTHIAGTIAGNGARSDGEFSGVAPEADIVDVRVLDSNGAGRLSSVIRGIEWVIAHRQAYGIRVLNMSFGAPANTSYRTDPLAAAVELAWNSGLVVVAAAGNTGPGAGTTASPGWDPYAITVGASDDAGTVNADDDTLAPFSSWGRADGGAKPDLVAPGRRIVSIRVAGSLLDSLFSDRVVRARNGAEYLRLSGTSMATAVASGAVALMLSEDPSLAPDQVKTALVSSARAYGARSGAAPPDPIADGSGLLDALAASRAAAPLQPSTQDAVTGAIGTTELPIRTSRALRPANAFARSVFPLIAHRAPLRWQDLSLGGLDWSVLTWDSVVWDGVAWDNFAWDSVAWDGVAWDSVAWDSIAWDSVAWDAFTFD